jgi:hypothetical protein
MGRNRVEPEFTPGAVRCVEDLGLPVDDVQAMGFKIVLHWSNVPAVSERDAYAISQRQAVIHQQREAERRRREAEQERKAAEWAAKFPVPRGIPAPDPNMSAVEVMFAADAHERVPSVREQLLDQELAHGKAG